MKIIVNEAQYKLIEAFIDEAKANAYPKEIKQKLGKEILYLLDLFDKYKGFEFVLALGNSVVLELVSDEGNTFVFNVAQDPAKVFKKWDQVTLTINPGNGEIDDPSYEYGLNQKVIRTSDDGASYDLLFSAGKKTGLTGNAVLPKVHMVKTHDITAPNSANQPQPNQTQPTQQNQPVNSGNTTNTPTPAPSTGTTGSTTGTTVQQGRIALEAILQDANLKKAFYGAPSLWQLFIAELQGKQAAGKGIITVMHLVNQYERKSLVNKLGGEFIVGGSVTVRPTQGLIFSYKINNQRATYKFDTTIEYIGTVKNHVIGEEWSIVGPIKGVKGIQFEIEFLKRNEDFENTFSCYLYLIINGKRTQHRSTYFQIELEESNGFEPQNKPKVSNGTK